MEVHMLFKAVPAVAVAAAAAAGLLAVPAAATPTTPTPTAGTIEIWVTPGNGAVAKILVTGAIGDYGTATTIDKNGKVDDNGDYVNVALKHGGFEVNSVELNKVTNAAPPMMANTTTCSVEFGGSGPVTLFNGTGMYAGITGTLHITERFAGVGPRYTSGPKKGQCNMSNNSQPLAFWGSITGAGKVSFT
jgi:hypothetical protein